MAVDLHIRATNQRDLLLPILDDINGSLADARESLIGRHPDPSAVARADWATDLGASQHVDHARAELAATLVQESSIRGALASIANPAEADTHEAALRAVLIEQAQLQVEVRSAVERKAATEARVEFLDSLSGEGRTLLQVAEDAVTRGKERNEKTTALLNSLGDAPLSTVVADAAAIDPEPARLRLQALLPTALFDRAVARHAEAVTHVALTQAHDASAQLAIGAIQAESTPLETAVVIAERDYVAAETALANYANSAAGIVAAAPASLDGIENLAELTDAQDTALNPADPTDFVAAAAAEAALALAIADLQVAQRALDDELLAELLGDPAADPVTAQAVVDSIITDDVTPARAAYDETVQGTLDTWEVEVPASLWATLRTFVVVDADLDRLADVGTVPEITDGLSDAEDALGQALDDRDDDARLHLLARRATAPRVAARAAAERTNQDRQTQYLRGDGPSGRTASDL